MKRQVRLSLAATSVAVLALVSACGNGETEPETAGDEGLGTTERILTDDGWALYTGDPQEGGTVTVLGGVDFASFDPAIGVDGGVRNLYTLLYRFLTEYTYDIETGEMELVGDLAESWESNDDSTVWTFTLKEDIYFEDGSPITAEDVKFGVERALDPSVRIGDQLMRNAIEGAADYEGIFEDSDGLDSIVVIDERTIEFHTGDPVAGFPYIMGTPPSTPFPADQVETPGQIADAPIASGPYRIAEYQEGERLTLERNEHWNADTDPIRAAYADGFEFLLNLDNSTIDQRMMAGQGDDADAVQTAANPLQPANLQQVQSNPDMVGRTVRTEPTCVWYMAFNMDNPDLDNLEVRQALNYALDKTSVQNAAGGEALADITHDMLLPMIDGREEFNLYETEGDAGDPELAAEMLAEAGYEDGLELTMDVRNLPMWQSMAEAVQQSYAEAGVDVTLNVLDAASYYDVIGTPSQLGDLAITGVCTRGWLTGQIALENRFHGNRIAESGNLNHSQYDSEETNQALDEAAAMEDIDEQNARYSEINRMIMEDAPVVPLLLIADLQMVGENVGGAFANPARTGYIDYSHVGLLDPEE
ncbi:ABC transporter substrate-binding protein [Nesterenkonia ebinurensis]|uniref:ABC transporter substrate-binding protein n=1 Tax=Nesterenkonia ebinurensis TaxID=2608252 RepID=UPI00123DA85B|nr:ABC transporter substrate-binding protein [Nesterenkonia ebinurensis]